jgi:hypothetical protein
MAAIAVSATAQQFVHIDDRQQKPVIPDLTIIHPLPVLDPGSALQAYLRQVADQEARLLAYHDETTVTAELPDTKQKGEYQLERNYVSQPKTLSFSNARFTGDGFVKTNVITRLLQSEVDHVEKGDPSESAINSKNYKFYYKGMEAVNGHDWHVFQVKPRRKAPGLFKGKIYLDVHSGNLRRVEGQVAKSPSFFVKDLEFVQDFDDVEGFTFPTELRSKAKARIIGRALVTIIHKGYRITKSTLAENSTPVTASQLGSR